MKLLITEKPSVAREFAKYLNVNSKNLNGYMEGNGWIITWCYGHLVTMSYPEVYDENLKCICYSAEFLKAKQTLVNFATEELKKRGCVFLDESVSS